MKTQLTMEKAQCIFYKERYTCKSLGDTGCLNRHMQMCIPEHDSGNVNWAARGIQNQLSPNSSSGSLRVFNYNPTNARYQRIKVIVIYMLRMNH